VSVTGYGITFVNPAAKTQNLPFNARPSTT
jgi:hypothetical protein